MNVKGFFYKKSPKFIVAIGVLAPLSMALVVALLSEVLNIHSDEENVILKIINKPFYFFVIILIAPIVETVIQYLPIKLAVAFFPSKQWITCLSIILSALIFTSLHKLSDFSSVVLFFAGLTWAFTCYVFMRKNSHPYIYVALTHSIYNFILLVLESTIYIFNRSQS